MNRIYPILIVTMLALISTYIVSSQVIKPYVNNRIEFASKIRSGQAEPPYRYRVLKPFTQQALEQILPIKASKKVKHAIASSTIAFIVLWMLFFLFHHFLKQFFLEPWPLVGLFLFQAVIPLSVSGFYMIGDFITVLFYLIGLNLITHQKHALVPFVVGVGALNREQVVFILVFHFIYLISTKSFKLNFKYILFGGLFYSAVFAAVRMWVGVVPSRFSVSYHISQNTDLYALLIKIVPLWLIQVGVLLFLSLVAFKGSCRFFRLSLLSLVVYTGLFFLKGNLWEMAKYLPAFLILIPMSLQVLSGRFVKDSEITS